MNWEKYVFQWEKNKILNPLEILGIPQKGPANTHTPLSVNVNNVNISSNR